MKKGKKIAALAVAAAMSLSSGLAVFASPASTNPETNGNLEKYNAWKTNWDSTMKNDYSSVSMTPGKTVAEMNFAWYVEQADASKTAAVRIATNEAMTENVKVFDEKGSLTINFENKTGTTYTKAVRATVTGLAENTTYYYQYTNDKSAGSWSDAEQLKTGDTSDFKMLYVGDPQIGSSGSIAHDAFNWEQTLTAALKENADLDFILSAGDQTEHATTSSTENRDCEIQYAGYLSASVLKNIPVATAIGNHEAKGSSYLNHFNNPNLTNQGTTTAGDDYYFRYGKTLFIILNSNNTNQSEHDAAMQEAIENNPDATWRIVMFHHDIYGAGAPHANKDGAQLRLVFAPLMDKYNVDICLTGHDHTYSRTYQILDGKAIDYDVAANGTITDPQGTLYMTANSASGSKYYDLVKTQQYYVADMSQVAMPSYSTISMTDSSFQINTYQVNADGSVTDLGDGIKLIKNVDKASLLSLIDKGEEKVAATEESTVTPSSWNALQTALTNAKNLLGDAYTKDESGIWNPADGTGEGYASGAGQENPDRIPDKTQDSLQAKVSSTDLNKTYTALMNAIDGLEAKGDATELNKAIDAAQKIVDEEKIGSAAGEYPQSAKEALVNAINSAKAAAGSYSYYYI